MNSMFFSNTYIKFRLKLFNLNEPVMNEYHLLVDSGDSLWEPLSFSRK